MPEQGRRVDPAELAVTLPADPRCRGLCKGDRGADDPPARPGHTRDGKKVLWCPCCGDQLRTLAEVYRGTLLTAGLPPNIRPELLPLGQVRLMDTICGYDVVVAKEIVAR